MTLCAYSACVSADRFDSLPRIGVNYGRNKGASLELGTTVRTYLPAIFVTFLLAIGNIIFTMSCTRVAGSLGVRSLNKGRHLLLARINIITSCTDRDTGLVCREECLFSPQLAPVQIYTA